MKNNIVYELYTMPDGNTTKDEKEYVRKWKEIIDPLKKILGCTCISFDPTIGLYNKEEDSSVNIPLWLARKIIDYHIKRNKMNIYLLFQSVNTNYDSYDSCVVVAESEEEAKCIHPNGRKWIKKNTFYEASGNWVGSPDEVTAVLIGTAAPKQKKNSVICASFNAG